MFPQRLKQLRKELGRARKVFPNICVTQQAVGQMGDRPLLAGPHYSGPSGRAAGNLGGLSAGHQRAARRTRGPFPALCGKPHPVIGTVRAGYGSLAFEEDYGWNTPA